MDSHKEIIPLINTSEIYKHLKEWKRLSVDISGMLNELGNVEDTYSRGVELWTGKWKKKLKEYKTLSAVTTTLTLEFIANEIQQAEIHYRTANMLKQLAKHADKHRIRRLQKRPDQINKEFDEAYSSIKNNSKVLHKFHQSKKAKGSINLTEQELHSDIESIINLFSLVLRIEKDWYEICSEKMMRAMETIRDAREEQLNDLNELNKNLQSYTPQLSYVEIATIYQGSTVSVPEIVKLNLRKRSNLSITSNEEMSEELLTDEYNRSKTVSIDEVVDKIFSETKQSLMCKEATSSTTTKRSGIPVSKASLPALTPKMLRRQTPSFKSSSHQQSSMERNSVDSHSKLASYQPTAKVVVSSAAKYAAATPTGVDKQAKNVTKKSQLQMCSSSGANETRIPSAKNSDEVGVSNETLRAPGDERTDSQASNDVENRAKALLADVRSRQYNRTELLVVEGGDHGDTASSDRNNKSTSISQMDEAVTTNTNGNNGQHETVFDMEGKFVSDLPSPVESVRSNQRDSPRPPTRRCYDGGQLETVRITPNVTNSSTIAGDDGKTSEKKNKFQKELEGRLQSRRKKISRTDFRSYNAHKGDVRNNNDNYNADLNSNQQKTHSVLSDESDAETAKCDKKPETGDDLNDRMDIRKGAIDEKESNTPSCGSDPTPKPEENDHNDANQNANSSFCRSYVEEEFKDIDLFAEQVDSKDVEHLEGNKNNSNGNDINSRYSDKKPPLPSINSSKIPIARRRKHLVYRAKSRGRSYTMGDLIEAMKTDNNRVDNDDGADTETWSDSDLDSVASDLGIHSQSQSSESNISKPDYGKDVSQICYPHIPTVSPSIERKEG